MSSKVVTSLWYRVLMVHTSIDARTVDGDKIVVVSQAWMVAPSSDESPWKVTYNKKYASRFSKQEGIHAKEVANVMYPDADVTLVRVIRCYNLGDISFPVSKKENA